MGNSQEVAWVSGISVWGDTVWQLTFAQGLKKPFCFMVVFIFCFILVLVF